MVTFAYYISRNSASNVANNLFQLVEEEEERQVTEVPEVHLVLQDGNNLLPIIYSKSFNFPAYISLKAQLTHIVFLKPPSA
jgi:hypothetical protein